MSEEKANERAEYHYQCRMAETVEKRIERRKRRKANRHNMRENGWRSRRPLAEPERLSRSWTDYLVLLPYGLFWVPVVLAITVLMAVPVFIISLFTNNLNPGAALGDSVDFFEDLFLVDWLTDYLR